MYCFLGFRQANALFAQEKEKPQAKSFLIRFACGPYRP
ncbi:hypothetical protein TFKS16_2574 [Tannerella forsythia KS16]|uniref:Uncharacterized protein n=1 Tax=Tannerella forsythia (strain ATCC 43037 / JCM 10827 / CCUG 21028 A / KCTC 5666 / FDC 338) TaxID=203275 RepID=G8UNC7_TANFA|nr:hypothetical protein BFO_2850 [Tannerella forsythia 92A2]BAR49931.1 hypothetical protein TF3313_2496 [Tannerella forsythia 3313]BAR52758.1 hypothetical protein TFKS16_2574 [Tannerella forsythia KS16]